MIKLAPIIFFLCVSAANAAWKLNPYTQRQDYYEPGVKTSSSTVLSDWSSSQTSFSSCVTGSTVTVTVSANSRVEIFFSGAVGADTQDMRFFSYMVNGVVVDAANAVTALYSPTTFNAVTMMAITDRLSAGTYSFCMTAATAGGNVFFYKSGPSANKFWVREVY